MTTTTDTGLVTGIKKSKTLKELVAGHDAQGIDEVRKVEVVGENQCFEDLLKKFDDCINYDLGSDLYLMECPLEDVLTPEEINQFLQMTIIYENARDYERASGQFITKLIQNSYDEGFNNFELNVNNSMEMLGYRLQGDSSNLMRMKIFGNLNRGYCLSSTNYLVCTIYGDVGERSANSCKNSVFNVFGNTGDFFGKSSDTDNSVFVVHGNVGEWNGHEIENSIFVVYGNVGKYCFLGAKSSDIVVGGEANETCGGKIDSCRLTINGRIVDNIPDRNDLSFQISMMDGRVRNSILRFSNMSDFDRLRRSPNYERWLSNSNSAYLIYSEGNEKLLVGLGEMKW